MNSKITKFDTSNLAIVRKEMEKALLEVGEKHGIKFTVGNIRYFENTFTAKVDAGTVDGQTGQASTKEFEALKQLGKSCISQELDINKEYVDPIRGKRLKFVGYMPRRRKAPVVILDLDTNKRYVIDERSARNIIEYKKAA